MVAFELGTVADAARQEQIGPFKREIGTSGLWLKVLNMRIGNVRYSTFAVCAFVAKHLMQHLFDFDVSILTLRILTRLFRLGRHQFRLPHCCPLVQNRRHRQACDFDH